MKVALISGASSGFGEACALEFAKHGWDTIITGRRLERLLTLKEKIESKYKQKCHTLCFDVRIAEECEAQIQSLPKEFQNIDVLVNNAGLSVGLNSIEDGLLEDWDRMIDTNVKGLLYLSKAVIPNMIKRKSGQIINIGSIAGKEAYKNGNVYCATKHAVEALTKSMRIDLLPYQIRVGSVSPGAAETEFSDVRFKGDKQRAKEVYVGYDALQAIDIAEAVYFMVSRPAHVNISDILIMPTAQANTTHLIKN